MASWDSNFSQHSVSQNVGDIRSEPTSIRALLLFFILEIHKSIPNVIQKGKLNLYFLLCLKYQIRFVHSHTRLRGNLQYNDNYKRIMDKLQEKEKNKVLWQEANPDEYLKYLDLLMELYDLEAETFERFGLIPAEDADDVWIDVDYEALGIVPSQVIKEGE